MATAKITVFSDDGTRRSFRLDHVEMTDGEIVTVQGRNRDHKPPTKKRSS